MTEWRGRLALAALPLLCGLPLITNDYTQYVANLAVVYALVATGFNIVIGFLGQIAFANAALLGLGAYTAGILMARWGLPFVLAVPAAGLAGGVAGVLISLPALRGIRFFYLGILTMAVGELLRWSTIQASGITGGSTGLDVPAPVLFGWALRSQAALYYVFLCCAAVLIGGTRNLVRSRIGRALVAVRENEWAAAALAIPTARMIMFAFGWSGMVTGVAGALFAVLIGRVIPNSFTLDQLVQQFAFVMVGGLGTVAGPVLGAALLAAEPELLRGVPGSEEIVFGLLLVLIVAFLPRGLAGLFGPQRFHR